MKTSFDSVAALLRELSIEEQQALLESDNRPAIKKFLLGLQTLLTQVGTIKVRLAEKFSEGEFFQVNIEKNAPVKISYLGENFKSWFLLPSGNEEVVPGGPYRTATFQQTTTEATFRYHTLNKRSVDGPIIEQLGGEVKAETTLVEIATCMKKQASGEAGALLINGYANIFYVRDINGVLRAVDVYWYGDGWNVNAHSVEDPDGWSGGRRVFSRDL